MRRGMFLMVLLALLLFQVANPLAWTIPAAIGNELNEKPFFAAADGAESSESLTVFAETTDDDTWFYPDSDTNLTFWPDSIAGWTAVGPGDSKTTGGSHTDTHTSNNVDYWCRAEDADASQAAYVYLNLSSLHDNDHYLTYLQIEYAGGSADDSFIIYLYDFVAETYDTIYSEGAPPTSDTTRTFAITGEEYTNSLGTSIVKLYSLETGFPFNSAEVYVDHVEGRWTERSPSGYAESFADVSEINATLGETVTTDGDLGTFHHPGDNAWDYYFWNAPSALAVQVIEWRCHANISTSSYEFALYSADDGGGSQLWASGSITAPTSAGTKKYSPMVIGVESIRLATRHASSPASFIFDYLRGGLSTETGWSHDGSTTAGVTGEVDCTVTTDGDKLNVTGTGAGDGYFYIYMDTTATTTYIEEDYYPFIEIAISEVNNADSDVKVGLPRLYGSDGQVYIPATWFTEACTLRLNIIPSSCGDPYKIRFYIDQTDSFTIDYIKLYSIANDTVTQSGAGTDDYLYVDSGILYSSIDDGYIELNHDPVLSVSDTYSVWNLTTSSTAPQFSDYVSSWSSYSSETRGALQSGTVTDIKLKFDSTEILSAIKFIEDGTAPAVVRSSSTPNDPEDDESTTLSAVITDTVEVYTVKFNAIVYPAGFSDVDYSANEQADNLWNYTFSSLDAGYYCFKIIASDGANTNALTEYAYIELTVREAAIRVEEITLIGAGSDFSMMTFSARINRDCSFTIYEESASSPEADTHTGSVTAPSFNLAWTKLDVDDANVNFTIRFTSGSLTENYTSQYQVAQTTFYVSTVTQMVSLDTVTVTGRITKLGAYQVYDDLDVLKDYGSITDLDFKIQFTRWGGYDEQNHDFAIKFTNGSQTCWYNSSFYAFKKPVVAAFQTTDPNALYAFQASFWTAVMIFCVLGMVAVDFYRRYLKK